MTLIANEDPGRIIIHLQIGLEIDLFSKFECFANINFIMMCRFGIVQFYIYMQILFLNK